MVVMMTRQRVFVSRVVLSLDATTRLEKKKWDKKTEKKIH